MDAVIKPDCSIVVIEAATQMLKTEIILNIVGRFMHLDPCPMLVVQPTLELAKSFSKDRLFPMLRDTPQLKEKMPRLSYSHDPDSTILHKRFLGGHITMAGANSAGSLAMRPVRLLFLDEVDRYPDIVGSEGDPVELAIKRTATFYNKKIIITSSPTIKGKSKVHKYFLMSNQNFFHVPCSKCSYFQNLIWENLKWDKVKLLGNKFRIKNIRYECASCQYHIKETEKTKMLSVGKWKAKHPSLKNGIHGFHINELYSPFKSWNGLIQTFLESKNDASKLQVFVNTSLAKEFEERGESPEWELLVKRDKRYSKNRVPSAGIILVAGVDVQSDRLEVEIKAYGKNKHSWSIDYRVLIGDPEGVPLWEKLDAILDEEFEHESGGRLKVRLMAIDSGFASNDVYQFGRRWGLSRVMVVKGSSTITDMISKPSIRDFDYRGHTIKRGVRLFTVNVHKLKGQIFSYLKTGDETHAGYMHFPVGYSEDYFKQLTAETLIKTKNRHGFYKYEYKKIRDRNEVLDCTVYARAASLHLGLDYLTDLQWSKLKEDVTKKKSSVPKKKGGVEMISRGLED